MIPGGKTKTQRGSGGYGLRYIEWTTPGTYTWDVPPELQQGGVVEIDGAAGGGGGGGGFSLGGGGGGGSGCEWCENLRLFIPVGAAQLTIVVGAGGAGGAGGGTPAAGSNGAATEVKYGATSLLYLNAGKGGSPGQAALPGNGANSYSPISWPGGVGAANANGGEANLTNAFKANFTDAKWNRGQIYPGMVGGAGTYATSGSFRSSRLVNIFHNQFNIVTPTSYTHTATDTGLGGASGPGYILKNVGGVVEPYQSSFLAPQARGALFYGWGGRGGRAAGSLGYAGEDGAGGFLRLVY